MLSSNDGSRADLLDAREEDREETLVVVLPSHSTKRVRAGERKREKEMVVVWVERKRGEQEGEAMTAW